MPRGIPNAKRDENSMRYTSFHVPLQPNPKHSSSSYLKSDNQTLWARNAARDRKMGVNLDAGQGNSRGSQALVIHPGSSFLRVGRSTQIVPTRVPAIIARKQRQDRDNIPKPVFVEGISRPRRARSMVKDTKNAPVENQDVDEYAIRVDSDDPFDQKLASIQLSLRDRMRFYKLRVAPNAASIASTFNDQCKPEILPAGSDSLRAPYIDGTDPEQDLLIGEDALRLSCPHEQGYVVRRPIYGRRFNTRDYPSSVSLQLLLGDLETILAHTLSREPISVERNAYKSFSVILLIPDFYEKTYVREWVHMLLVTMGFQQVTVMQESLAATYGAGISNACVVDIGATATSIACVDDGLVLQDTRMTLLMGGNDVTEFLYVLLDRIGFPYRDIDLARSFDWEVAEDLKTRLCTLAEGDVALNLYEFTVRAPGKPTRKYGLRAYDEVILAPMCIFEPRVVEFDRKRAGVRPSMSPDVQEDIIEQPPDLPTQAMMISTQHLAMMLAAAPPPAPPPVPSVSIIPSEVSATLQAQDVDSKPRADSAADPDPLPSHDAPAVKVKTEEPLPSEDVMDVDAEPEVSHVPEPRDPEGVSEPSTAQPTQPPTPYPLEPPPVQSFSIDVCFEASKLPLDVAIFNSARAAGGDEKIRKYLQAVLIVGGGSCVPGMNHALESRLQAIATPLVPNMEKVTIIPPPKGTDPRDLTWKGGAVLAKMDGLSDLWLTRQDWDFLGMRGLKERCFHL